MKIFISVDMEGATGVVHGDQLTHKGEDYARSRRLLTGDVNAAVRGAVRAGASEIVVTDGHGTMRNILIEELDEHAQIVLGPASSKNFCQVEGVDSSFTAGLFIGYHARANTFPAVLPHTWVGMAISEFRINGKVMGETGINAGVLGAHGVPVAFVAGDDALVREAKETLGEVAAVATKFAIGRAAARCLTPKKTAAMIEDSVYQVLTSKKFAKPLKHAEPAVIEITFHRSEMAHAATRLTYCERVDEWTVRINSTNYLDAVQKAWWAAEQVIAEPAFFLK